MENKVEICRLCLKAEGTDFLPLDEYRITKLKEVIPQMNIDVSESGRFLMCMKCKEGLDESFNMRRMILDNQELICSRKSKLGVQTKVNLDRLFSENESNRNENTICRICLNLSKEKSIFIDSLAPDDSFQDVLHMCLSVLDRELIANPLICVKCVDKLLDMFAFISSSMTIENKIRQYCESNPETRDLLQNKNLDLNEVLVALKDAKGKDDEQPAGNDFLSEFEVQDEEGNDIFDSLPEGTPANYAEQRPEDTNNTANPQWQSDYDTTKKQPADAPAETVPAKRVRQKKKKQVILTEDLTYFKFTYNLLYNNVDGQSLSEWLSLVDLQKKKFNWSDNVTIQKVLLRLQDMPEVWTWFSSMGDILSWEEWKTKLLEAFPDKDDFCMTLKRALARRRKTTEKFVTYMSSKAELLKKVNITGRDAISCIINGVTSSDSLVCCLTRMGKFETFEELTEHFEKWDEKEAVTDKTHMNQDKAQAPAPNITNFAKASKPKVKLTPPKFAAAKNQLFSDFKKMKKKCFKCLQLGHLAFECSLPAPVHIGGIVKPLYASPNLVYTPPKPMFTVSNLVPMTKAPAATPKVASPAAKAKKPPAQYCRYCAKFGHVIEECFYVKLGKPSPVSANQIASANQPNGVLSPVVKVKSPKSLVQCGYCSKRGHTADVCRFANKKAAANALKEATAALHGLAPPKTQADAAETQCQSCGSKKHYTRHCGKRLKRAAPTGSMEWSSEEAKKSRWSEEPVKPPEPARHSDGREEPVRHSDRREDPVRHSDRREEPVRHSDRREEPVRHHDRHEEPVRHHDRHEEPMRHHDRHEEPVRYSDRHDESVRYSDRREEPGRYSERHDESPRYRERSEDRVRYSERDDEHARYSERDESPVRYSERDKDPVRYSGRDEDPVRYPERDHRPVRYPERHDEPVRYPEKNEEPVRHPKRRTESVKYPQMYEACYHCGSMGHLPTACYYSSKPSLSDSKKKKTEDPLYKQLMCFNCYKVGHETKECPKSRAMIYRP